ncbi:hypothetical protein [Acinetobacter calcoaceticus]|uniref:hypothetical protein n=1 Tax=Acinetobacter calcoaceticus TaxID=471 RepID=UPI0002D0BA93|nr:hypothetical protein [Acinetobacter calcoaceticus]ENU11074.1 hypothetical protein F997_00079 [Acinetobacter calcoaceticus NIPH 13]
MLFNEEELALLKYFPETAVLINNIYNRNKSHETLVNKSGDLIQTSSLFFRIKEFIISLDKYMTDQIFITEGVESNIRILNYRISANYDLSHRTEIDVIGKFLDLFFFFLSTISKIRVSEYKSLYELLNELNNNFETIYEDIKNLSNDFYDATFLSDSNYRLVLLDERINELGSRLDKISNIFLDESNKIIEPRRIQFIEDTNKVISDFQKELSQIHAQFIFSIKDDADKLEKSIKSTDADFKATYEDYNILKKMVNAKGEQLITDHYDKKASQEKKVYWSATITTIVIIILSISLAMCGLSEYNERTNIPTSTLIEKYKDQSAEKIEKIYAIAQKNALIYLILRLIISLLIFSSIIYTSRVAYRAYIHMRHSENMMLKLATLRPFINQLEKEDRNQIHKDLIPDYFGKDAGMVDSTNEKFKDLPANVSAVAMKAIEQISGSGSNSNTERNGKKPDGGTE